MTSMSIIMVGETLPGSRTPQRRRAMEELGHHVRMVSTTPDGSTYETPPSLIERLRYRLRLPVDKTGANTQLLRTIDNQTSVVWIENARMIRASTLVKLRSAYPGLRLVWYSEDDTMNPRHRSRYMDKAIPLYDLWVTTKSFNAQREEVPSLGGRRVLFVNNSYDPSLHKPMPLSDDERHLWGADITFVGTYEAPRAKSLLALAKAGMTVRVWGNNWELSRGLHPGLRIEGRAVYDEDYARICSASSINLAFLRKFNRDLQTCRSIEIPACGGFMLHERNNEIVGLFAENREAAFFGDDDELIAQCRFWLANEQQRLTVAAAGRASAVKGLAHHDVVGTVLRELRGCE